jgi:hypothetical protein
MTDMIIERTNKEVIIRLRPTVDTDELQELANFFRYKEITSGYKTEQPVVDQLASDINKNWYKANRDRLLK